MCQYPCASGYLDERIADAGPLHTRAHLLRPCARARVCVCDWAPMHPREHMRALSRRRWTVLWFGAQAFQGATAFNANIGAWNTASVTSLSYVCAAFGRRRTTSV